MSHQYHVSERVRAHLTANPFERPADTAAALGLTVAAVYMYRSRLIAQGLIPPRKPARITDDEIAAIVEHLEAGADAEQVRRDLQLPISKDAIHRRLYSRGLTVTEVWRNQVFTTTEICRLFGYAHRNTQFLVRVRTAGLTFRCTGRKRGRGRWYRITADDLMTFLDTPANWRLFTVGRITNPDWRAYAQDAQDRYHLRTAKKGRAARERAA